MRDYSTDDEPYCYSRIKKPTQSTYLILVNLFNSITNRTHIHWYSKRFFYRGYLLNPPGAAAFRMYYNKNRTQLNITLFGICVWNINNYEKDSVIFIKIASVSQLTNKILQPPSPLHAAQYPPFKSSQVNKEGMIKYTLYVTRGRVVNTQSKKIISSKLIIN